jgi:hypothetical protein
LAGVVRHHHPHYQQLQKILSVHFSACEAVLKTFRHKMIKQAAMMMMLSTSVSVSVLSDKGHVRCTLNMHFAAQQSYARLGARAIYGVPGTPYVSRAGVALRAMQGV